MTTSEKVAYLKGLAEGMQLDTEGKEGKLISVIIDILEDVALDVEDLEDSLFDLSEEFDAIVEELDECCCDDCDDDDGEYDCSHPHHDGHHHHHGDCCHGHDKDDEPVFYEIACPNCENTITVDEDVLLLEQIECPNCGESLEFEFDVVEDDEE